MDEVHRQAIADDPGFTQKQYADHYGIPMRTACDRLRRLAIAGKVDVGFRHINGRLVKVFSPRI